MVIDTICINASITKKIAVLSDLHNSPKWKDITIPPVDLILIPGDLVKSYGYGWDNAYKFLKYAQSIAQVVYSVGNHECLSPVEWHKLVQDLGVIFLNNMVIELDEITIGGIQDWYDDISVPVLEELEKSNKYKILLSHRPELYEPYLKNRRIDLIVSGHAHGGQMRLFGKAIYAPNQGFFPKYTDGLYDGKFLVSAGLENTRKWIPRIGNPKKFYILDLKGDNLLS